MIRFRRAEGVERQQIKWLAYAGCFAVCDVPRRRHRRRLTSDNVANAVILPGVLSLPLAVGIAILRYRLYDIDLLINRTLVYGGLTLAVVTVYVALVGALSALLPRERRLLARRWLRRGSRRCSSSRSGRCSSAA